MPNYGNGKIYKIVNTVDSEIYVGGTALYYLCKRMGTHRQNANIGSEQKVYAHFDRIGWKGVAIELLESYPCNSKDELSAREAYWINRLKPSLNMRMPGAVSAAGGITAYSTARCTDRIICKGCGTEHSRSNYTGHKRTQKHKDGVIAAEVARAAMAAAEAAEQAAMDAYIDEMCDEADLAAMSAELMAI